MQPKFAIIIPARYGSSRFPGKPLHVIAGKPMLQWVYEVACKASQTVDNAQVLIATDDASIADFAAKMSMDCVMTPINCLSGTDRVNAAVDLLATTPDFVINLQGDSPLTPVSYLTTMLQAVIAKPSINMATLCVQLTFADLDNWRAHKKLSPTSGTSVVMDKNNRALWFSKNIMPMIRDEQSLRKKQTLSPIYKHLGIYGYTPQMLKTFTRLPQSQYEQLEGLEQLRLLENGYHIDVIETESQGLHDSLSVDTPEDAIAVQAILKEKIELV